MVNPIQTLRSPTPGQRPPAGKLEGELYVNFADKALGVVDPAGANVDLTAVRHWSAEASYAKDDHVIQDGRMYSARDAIAPGPFVEARWFKLTRKRLYAPLQLYVDGATGNDLTGDGTQAAPWATPYKAGEWISQELDINAQNVVVRVAAGDYDYANFSEMFGGGIVNIVGAGKDVTNIRKINAVNSTDTRIILMAMTLKPLAGDYACPINNSRIQIEGTTGFAIDLTLTTYGVTVISFGGSLWAYGPIEIRTNGLSGASCFRLQGGCEWSDDGEWTLTGAAPNTYQAFVRLDRSYYIGSGSFTGASLGKRFELVNDSHADTTATIVRDGDLDVTITPGDASNRRLDLFPGDVDGTWDSSSWYDGVQGGKQGRRLAQWGDAFYVDAAGDDANDGESAATAWATLQRAADFFSIEYDFSTVVVPLAVGAGAFVGPKFWNLVGGSAHGGKLAISGAGVDLTIITDNGLTSAFSVEESDCPITVSQMTLRAGTGAAVNNAEFGLVGPLALECANVAAAGESFFFASGAIELRQTGAAPALAALAIASHSHLADSAQWTLSGATSNIYPAWASLDEHSYYSANTGSNITSYTGACVGSRYKGAHGAIFNSAGLGQNLLPGDAPGTLDASSFYDGVQGGQRRILTANETYYVDAAGLDTNDGLSAATAWATLERVNKWLTDEVDINIRTVTINVGAGTFDGIWLDGIEGSGVIVFQGAGVDVTILQSSTAAWACFCHSDNDNLVQIKGMTLRVRAAIHNPIWLYDAAMALMGGIAIEAGPCASFIFSVSGERDGSSLELRNAFDYRQTGADRGGYAWAVVRNRSYFKLGSDLELTLSGATPDIFAKFVEVTDRSDVFASGMPITGTMLCQKFLLYGMSKANSGSALGIDYFPGDQAGVCDTTSFYDGVIGVTPMAAIARSRETSFVSAAPRAMLSLSRMPPQT